MASFKSFLSAAGARLCGSCSSGLAIIAADRLLSRRPKHGNGDYELPSNPAAGAGTHGRD